MPRDNPLEAWSIKLSRLEFGKLLLRHLKETHPGWSADKLVIHPTEALRFCNSVQELFVTPVDQPIPEDMILGALLAARKRGKRK